MPRTPDRTPGPSQEEELQLEDNGLDPSVVGAITQNAGTLKGRDSTGIFDLRSGSGLSDAGHRSLDQLVHDIAEDSFDEILYSGNKVTDIITWTNSGKTKKIREELFTYTGSKVTKIVTKQYDDVGTLIVGETMTEDVVYTSNQVDTITRVVT